MKEVPFTYFFDEITNEKVEKQYDAYIQYRSKPENKIVTVYCGSVFSGHCKKDDLVKYFLEFMKEFDLEPKYLLQLSMDEPNMNLSFESELLKQLQSTFGTTFLKIGSCPLFKVHNYFRKGVKSIEELDVEQFVTDLHSFLKYSSARREDYSALSEVTDVTAWCMLRFVSSRWLRKSQTSLTSHSGSVGQSEAVFLGISPFRKRIQGARFSWLSVTNASQIFSETRHRNLIWLS